MKKKTIIGIVGPFGSGKTTVAKYLTDHSFISIKLSSFLKEEAKKRFGKIDRQGLQDIGNEFRKKYGANILVKWAIEKAKNEKRIVIDGIRNLAEINFLKKQDGFYLLGVIADPEIRFKRLRYNETKGLSNLKDFLRLDARDKGRGQGKIGLQVNKCLKKANYLIINNETTKDLYQKINLFLKSL